MIAVNAVTAATPERLQEQKRISDYLRLMRDSGNYPTTVPTSDAIKGFNFGTKEVGYLDGISNREVVGLPGEVKKKILDRAKKYDADEVMLTMITHKLSDKIESFRLLSEAFGL